MHKAVLAAVAVAVLVIGGCGGATLLAQALGLIKVADLVLDLKERVTTDEEETLTVLLDGYVVRTDAPNRAGALELAKLPTGQFLISLVSADRRNGWHGVVDIGGAGRREEVNPFSGPVISGTVVRTTEAAGQVPVANAVVVGFQNGADRLAAGQGPLQIGGLSTGGHMMAMTNDRGEYTLGPAAFGEWLVAAAIAGHFADAEMATVRAGADVRGVKLTLEPNAAAQAGTVAGTVVSSSSGNPLSGALARADLGSALSATVPAATKARVDGKTGLTLPAGAWFRWHFLATKSGSAGDYALSVPAGALRVWAYKFGYAGAYRDVAPTAGSLVSADFRLSTR